jgi:hypothetical protein
MLAYLKTNPTCRIILVEKTDRLYRNIKDWITVDSLDLMVHFVKEGAVVSKESRSWALREAPACVHGAPNVWQVRLHDDRRKE